jgi:hypothetical protein
MHCLPRDNAEVAVAAQIPIAILGLFIFDSKWSVQNILSICVALLAGVIFVRAKQLAAAAA